MPRRTKARPAANRFWVGYCRKSTETEDRQIYTLQDQASMIREYYDRLPIQERERRPLLLLEEARSAYHPGRPVFADMLGMASRGEVYGVIVVHPNRISRNHIDSGAFVQRLVDGQIECLDTTGGKRYTGAGSNDIFMLTLEGAMSWKDSRDKGDRILQAMRKRAAEGRHMSLPPIGYRSVYRPDGTKVLETDPDRAPQVRRLFGLAATGTYSLQDLAAEAWRSGVRSRSGKKITKPCIHKLLRNPFFKGYVRFDGIEAKGVHEPLVEEAIWLRVQDALLGRRTGTSRPKDLTLRELFFFGNLLRCPKCSRTLNPYRARGRYVYYECKNPETNCGVCVPQRDLVGQLQSRLSEAVLPDADLALLRDRLMDLHGRKSAGDVDRRRSLNEAYEQVQREIGTVFARRSEAEALGIQDAVDLHLAELRRKRDELQTRLNVAQDDGTDWIDQVIRAFELGKLLQEAVQWGSRHTREQTLAAFASNYSVDRKNLILKLRTPFRERVQEGGRLLWWSSLYEVREEIMDTCMRLENAFSALKQAECS